MMSLKRSRLKHWLSVATIVFWPALSQATIVAATLAERSKLTMDFSAVGPTGLEHTLDKWTHGVYIRLDRTDPVAPCFYEFSASGKPVAAVTLKIPEADHISIQDFDAAPDGSIVAVGSSTSAGSWGQFIARMAPNGGQATIIRTSPFAPRLVTVAPDGSFWTVGYEILHDATGRAIETNRSADTLRHFDPSGRLIASGFPFSGSDPNRAISGYLTASATRVAWYSPEHGNAVCVEIAPDFSVLNRYDGVPIAAGGHSLATGFALTEGGQSYVTVTEQGTPSQKFGLYRLDRNTGMWVSIPLPPTARPNLVGEQGEALVFHELGSDFSIVRFFDVRE